MNNVDQQTLLLALQGLWGLVLALIGLLGTRLHQDLRNNTKATQEIAKSIGELTQKVIGEYATKSEVTRLDDKYDKLNREMGEVTVLMRMYREGGKLK